MQNKCQEMKHRDRGAMEGVPEKKFLPLKDLQPGLAIAFRFLGAVSKHGRTGPAS
jgi:hypothetical protein